ncbi:hypothetical protein OEZ86_009432 [Tetradesmus obliquus]|nr:hypothetical protein OEZ86_009432 [Tetradesmus obliquus]
MTWLLSAARLPASQTFPIETQGPTFRQRGMADALPGVFFETTATLVESIVDAIVTAWSRDPHNTQATVLVPEWPTANWYRRYIRRKRPLFRVLHRYPAGSNIFRWKDSTAMARPTTFPILILRIGHRG